MTPPLAKYLTYRGSDGLKDHMYAEDDRRPSEWMLMGCLVLLQM